MAGYRALLADPASGGSSSAARPPTSPTGSTTSPSIAVIIYVWQHGAFELALLAVALHPALRHRRAVPRGLGRSHRAQAGAGRHQRGPRRRDARDGGRAQHLRSCSSSSSCARSSTRLQPGAPGGAAGDHARAAAGPPPTRCIRASDRRPRSSARRSAAALMLLLPVQGVFVVNGAAVRACRRRLRARDDCRRGPRPTQEHPTIWSQFGAGLRRVPPQPADVRGARLRGRRATSRFFLYDTQIGLLDRAARLQRDGRSGSRSRPRASAG